MPNITLQVDEDVLKKVRRVALEKNTTLTAMVREYLTMLAHRDEPRKDAARRQLQNTFQRLSRDMGRRTWTREDAHAR